MSGLVHVLLGPCNPVYIPLSPLHLYYPVHPPTPVLPYAPPYLCTPLHLCYPVHPPTPVLPCAPYSSSSRGSSGQCAVPDVHDVDGAQCGVKLKRVASTAGEACAAGPDQLPLTLLLALGRACCGGCGCGDSAAPHLDPSQCRQPGEPVFHRGGGGGACRAEALRRRREGARIERRGARGRREDAPCP